MLLHVKYYSSKDCIKSVQDPQKPSPEGAEKIIFIESQSSKPQCPKPIMKLERSEPEEQILEGLMPYVVFLLPIHSNFWYLAVKI